MPAPVPRHKLPRYDDDEAVLMVGRDLNAMADLIEENRPLAGRGVTASARPDGIELSVVPAESGAYPPFALLAIAETNPGEFDIVLKEGLVINPDPKGADGLPEAVIPVYNGDALDDDPRPEIPVTFGDFVYVKMDLDQRGQLDGDPEIIIRDAEEEGTHYAPESLEEGGGIEGEHYRKILQIIEDPEVSGQALIISWQKSDIEIEPYIWEAENVGTEGQGPYHIFNPETGRHEFRRHIEIYGHEVTRTGAAIEHQFDAENMDPGTLNGADSAQVYRPRAETEGEGATIKAEFRPLTQGIADDRQEIEVKQIAGRIEIRGNNYHKPMIVDDEGSAVNMVVVVDGLVTSMSDLFETIKLKVCKAGATASDPPTEVEKKFIVLK